MVIFLDCSISRNFILLKCLTVFFPVEPLRISVPSTGINFGITNLKFELINLNPVGPTELN